MLARRHTFASATSDSPRRLATSMTGVVYTVEWRLGATHVTVDVKERNDQMGTEFRLSLRSALLERRERLYPVGIDQVVATAMDNYAVAWM